MSAVKTDHLLPAIMLMVGEMAASGARERLKNALDKYKEVMRDDSPLGQVKQTAALGAVVASGDQYVEQMEDAIREYRKAQREVAARESR